MPSAHFNTRDTAALSQYGFKLVKGGAHTSRTMMLTELESVLRTVPCDAPDDAYAEAILELNTLGKETVSSRKKSLSHLRELYGLTPKTPLFLALRTLHQISQESLPQLALLVALARDPLLRVSANAILSLPEGRSVTPADISAAIEKEFLGTYSPKSLLSISQNCASTWAQAGHLVGRAKKVRRRPQPTPVACVLAFLMGEVTGHQGAAVFSNPWCRALGLDPERARNLGFEAHRRGLLNLRAIGDVVEIGFPCLPEAVHPIR